MKEKISGLSIKLITSVLLLSVLLCAAISYMGYESHRLVADYTGAGGALEAGAANGWIHEVHRHPASCGALG